MAFVAADVAFGSGLRELRGGAMETIVERRWI